MLLDPDIAKTEFETGTGWQLKPEGACQGDVCIPLSKPPGDQVDVEAVARAIGMPLVGSPEHGALGARARRRSVAHARERPGAGPALAGPRGQGVPRCRGCAARRSWSMPGHRIEAAPATCPCGRHCATNFTQKASSSSRSGSIRWAAPAAAIHRGSPAQPSIVVDRHQCSPKSGVINIPSSVWINEKGMIVRPAEPAPAPPQPTRGRGSLPPDRRSARRDHGGSGQDPPRHRRLSRGAARLGGERRRQPVRAVAGRGDRPVAAARCRQGAAATRTSSSPRSSRWRPSRDGGAAFREAHR